MSRECRRAIATAVVIAVGVGTQFLPGFGLGGALLLAGWIGGGFSGVRWYRRELEEALIERDQARHEAALTGWPYPDEDPS